MRNVYFTHGTRNEQFLQQNLVEEFIKMFGMDVLYIPRQYISTDKVFNEEIISRFDDSYIIEAYLENAEGFQGGGDLLTKFGIRQSDEITLVISQQRFQDFISQYTKLDPDILLADRPSEGDLIYFPLTANFFEIKFIEHEEPFYQLGKNYVYKLKCELFEYQGEEGEVFDEDEDLAKEGYVVDYFYLTTIGTTATATPIVGSGKITNISITNPGAKYNTTPTVTLSAPQQGGGVQATAKAYMIAINTEGGNPIKHAVIRGTVLNGTLRSVTIVDGGEGYDIDRTSISVSDPDSGGVKAMIKPSFTNGKVTSLAITNSGSNYKSVKVIDITNPGSGYTSATASFTPAPAGVTGQFLIPEEIVGSQSQATATAVDWNAEEGFLSLKGVAGTFKIGESLVGQTSNASMILDRYDDLNVTEGVVDKYYENDLYESLGDGIIDFSETNPFGIAT